MRAASLHSAAAQEKRTVEVAGESYTERDCLVKHLEFPESAGVMAKCWRELARLALEEERSKGASPDQAVVIRVNGVDHHAVSMLSKAVAIDPSDGPSWGDLAKLLEFDVYKDSTINGEKMSSQECQSRYEKLCPAVTDRRSPSTESAKTSLNTTDVKSELKLPICPSSESAVDAPAAKPSALFVSDSGDNLRVAPVESMERLELLALRKCLQGRIIQIADNGENCPASPPSHIARTVTVCTDFMFTSS